MKTTEINKYDKEAIRSFVELINENHAVINVSVSFAYLENVERFNFRVNGKLQIKDNIDTAIAFLDGVLTALDVVN